MKKLIYIFTILTLVSIIMTSCGPEIHEHTWNDATLDSPKICSGCQEEEGISIREMLIGDWREDNSKSIFLCVEFTDAGFNGNIVIGGKKTDTLSSKGTIELSDGKLNLWDSNNNLYIYFTYTITNNSIELIDYEGNRWIKTTL